MIWEKRGLIFKAQGEYGWVNSHAQVPTVLVLDDRLRIYYSPRPQKNCSCIAAMDVDLDDPKKILVLYDKPILEHGKGGMFDEHGVMPQCVLRDEKGRTLLYYAGWSRREEIPYSNWVGVAESFDDGLTFKKCFEGPILDRTPNEVLSGTGLFVFRYNGLYYGFYANGTKWYKVEHNLESAYEICLAVSSDGIAWKRNGVPILKKRSLIEANTRPTVIRINDLFHMWFCYRGVEDYRDGINSYQIGHATSRDLNKWDRDDELIIKKGKIDNSEHWDSHMTAYPYVVHAKDHIYMFYNGNGFGQAGFGFAELREEDSVLSKKESSCLIGRTDMVNQAERQIDILCDPESKERLVVEENRIVNPKTGKMYEISNGIPVLVDQKDLEANKYALDIFKREAPVYDEYKHLTFDTFKIDENTVRNSLIDKLGIRDNMRILELSCGTGRDSRLIRNRMDASSTLYVQDISMDMLLQLKKKFKEEEVLITQSDATKLPYKDNSFDAVYSFGGVGMGTYGADSGTSKIMSEIVRISKVGAKVVIGNLGLAPWLRNTEFANILINHNRHYSSEIDLRGIPIEARDVNIGWILNGAGLFIEFTVGEGEPEANFDFLIPGVRGGTLRTRFYGHIEGVSPEMKELASKAREVADISMYDFLNEAIKEKANKILGGGRPEK